MSIQKIKNIFSALSSCDAWSMQLLKISTFKDSATIYMSREISFSPIEKVNDFVKEISNDYIGSKGKIDSYADIRGYDGSALDKTIYKLSVSSELINTEYQNLLNAISTPDAEIDPFEFKFQASILNGSIRMSDDTYPVKLITMRNPITTLKHKYGMSNGSFKEISEKVLSLRSSIDVIIFDGIVYMLTLEGEKLFNMERSYKQVSISKIAAIQTLNIVTDFEVFSAVAGSGQNPRKFISFNNSHLQKLKNGNSRKKIARKFNIPMIGDKFDTTNPDASDKIVKLLCDRGMVDPFDDNPMEVAGSKKWV